MIEPAQASWIRRSPGLRETSRSDRPASATFVRRPVMRGKPHHIAAATANGKELRRRAPLVSGSMHRARTFAFIRPRLAAGAALR